MQELLSKEADKYEARKRGAVAEWKKIEGPFFRDVKKFLDFENELGKISEINVLLTPYGTPASFYPLKKSRNIAAFATSRIDFPAENIASSILHILYILKTRNGGEIGEDDFIKRMEVINFLTTGTCLSKYFGKRRNILRVEIDSIADIFPESRAYLKKLGFPAPTNDFTAVKKMLSPQERKILDGLEKANGKILSADEIADIVWGENSDEEFSLESISKTIQNLREKIRACGIRKNPVQTVRGRDYFFSSGVHAENNFKSKSPNPHR